MKKFLAATLIAATLAIAVGGLAFAQTAPAAQANSGQALEIGPPVINIAGDPGTTIQARISLRDVSPQKLIVSNEINDFVAGDETGTPKILLKSTDTSPYSIRSWITPLPKFTLVPRQIQTLNVTIKIPKDAAPGGYYGVIRFTGTPPELEGTGVSLSASLGSLILLRVNGNVKEHMSVAELYSESKGQKTSLFQSAPITLTERLKNDGNIHEQPLGSVTVTDMFGKNIASIAINTQQGDTPPRNVLPGSIRKFQQVLDSSVLGNKFLFGKYTVKLDMIYGSGVAPLTAKAEFWVIPYTLIGIIIIALIVLFFVIRYALRAYAQRLLNQSGGGRRRR
jgi:hypothetical protein